MAIHLVAPNVSNAFLVSSVVETLLQSVSHVQKVSMPIIRVLPVVCRVRPELLPQV